MTGLTEVSWPTVTGSALLALAVSPLLAGWNAELADGRLTGWWRLRRVTGQRSVVVAAAAAVLGALAGAGGPWAAWWLFAAGGRVLAVVDADKQSCPPGWCIRWPRSRPWSWSGRPWSTATPTG